MITEGTATISWNGPVCPICHKGYLGSHVCDVADLQAQIERLQQLIDSRPVVADTNPYTHRQQFDPSTCPCSPARGGSGICGCTLTAPTITC